MKLSKGAVAEVRRRIEAEVERVRQELGKVKYVAQRKPLLQHLGGLRSALDLFPKNDRFPIGCDEQRRGSEPANQWSESQDSNVRPGGCVGRGTGRLRVRLPGFDSRPGHHPGPGPRKR